MVNQYFKMIIDIKVDYHHDVHDDYWYPLPNHKIITQGYSEVVEILLRHGADPNQKVDFSTIITIWSWFWRISWQCRQSWWSGPAWQHCPPPGRLHQPCSCCHPPAQVGLQGGFLISSSLLWRGEDAENHFSSERARTWRRWTTTGEPRFSSLR